MPSIRPLLAARICCLLSLLIGSVGMAAEKGQIAYLVSDQNIPFWDIMWRGVRQQAQQAGYRATLYSAHNDAKLELQNMVKALAQGVDGIVLSPTNSSAAVTLLKLAKQSGVPVVISDIGADSGDYVSYIGSDNRQGSYELGQLLVRELQARGWHEALIGIIAIPQSRANGKARTAGFLQALAEAGIHSADLRQQRDFSYQETYHFVSELIALHPNLRAVWLQGSNQYQAALDAIGHAGKKDAVLLICFDAEPEFMSLIPSGDLLGAGMQQPYLMGQNASATLIRHLQGETVPHRQKLPVMAVDASNIQQRLALIRRSVLGLETE